MKDIFIASWTLFFLLIPKLAVSGGTPQSQSASKSVWTPGASVTCGGYMGEVIHIWSKRDTEVGVYFTHFIWNGVEVPYHEYHWVLREHCEIQK